MHSPIASLPHKKGPRPGHSYRGARRNLILRELGADWPAPKGHRLHKYVPQPPPLKGTWGRHILARLTETFDGRKVEYHATKGWRSYRAATA